MSRTYKFLKLGEELKTGLPRSFSGQDFKAWAYYPVSTFNKITSDASKAGQSPGIPAILKDGQIPLGELHTITTSFAASVSPVVRIGESMPVAHTRGQKTYAGSLIFTVLDKDPLKELILSSEYSDAQSSLFTIDQIPPFNIIIWGDNEYLPVKGVKASVYKILIGVQFVTHGESITIDDFYLEQSYQYRCRYVSQWMTGVIDLDSVYQGEGIRSSTTIKRIQSENLSDKQVIAAVSSGQRLDRDSRERLTGIGSLQPKSINSITTTPSTTYKMVTPDGYVLGTAVRRNEIL